MDIKAESKGLAVAVTQATKANGKVVETLARIIENNVMGKDVIEDFIEAFAKSVTTAVTPSTLKVYKSQIRKIMTQAISNKAEVLQKAKEAGNLDKWYKSFFDKAESAPTGAKTTKSDGKAEPKLGAEDKQPSEARDPIKEFHDAASTMLDAGMTAKQLHAVIDELVKQRTAKAA